MNCLCVEPRWASYYNIPRAEMPKYATEEDVWQHERTGVAGSILQGRLQKGPC